MGNSLCAASGSAAVKPAMSKQTSNLSGRSAQSTSSGGKLGTSLNRISSHLNRISSKVLHTWRGRVETAASAANRHQLEDRLAEVIKAKAASGEPRPAVRFNRLLLRFPALHEGFGAARAVFRELAGSDAGELNQAQMRGACAQLGYHLDDAAFDRIFGAADMDHSSTLNQHEFVAVLAILHILKGPEDEEKVPEAVLGALQTAEDAFRCCMSTKDGYLDSDELTRLMHEGATDKVQHSASGKGGDPIKAIAARRFAELDREGTGRVSFLQFLFCLENWVEDAEEEDKKV
jgi:Ca2+-binding EF-hand superfamily protein